MPITTVKIGSNFSSINQHFDFATSNMNFATEKFDVDMPGFYALLLSLRIKSLMEQFSSEKQRTKNI